jgi:S-adenosylmethionine:diacylglycerol 3-amino-3-carboxypropyl transferase
MKPEVIDVTGLSPQQIAMLQEIVAAFRTVSQQQNVNQPVSHSVDEEEQLKQLHKEFDWWVADVGVKGSINRSSIYGIE